MEIIKPLSEDTISQIAAGEVVERPAHLVKEIVENALDAGANDIEVDFDDGGRFVKVKDNGKGISKDQMPLALARHATSKISKTNDLWKIKTFGFRGEALASIASVSDLTLISQVAGETLSYRLRSVFGKEEDIETIGGNQGTTVIIRSLFENVPARFKFLKTPSGENTAIKNTLKALALSHSKVNFRILNKGKLLFYWPPQMTLLERSKQILSVEDLYFTEETRGAYKVSAVVAAPNKTLKNRRTNWIFVSNRWVECRVMQAALMSAYRGLLMHGEYPIAVLKIEGPSQDIDVNVHPSKSQIRFKDSSFIFKLVESSIRNLLEQAPWVKKVTQKNSFKREENLKFENKDFHQTQFHLKKFQFQNQYDQKNQYSKEVLSQLAWKSPQEKFLEQNTSSAKSLKNQLSWSSLQVLAQSHLTYIICQSDHSLVLIDQHAAHERILYEKLFNSWKKGGIDIQRHLVPLNLDLEEDQLEALLSLKGNLEKMGVSIEQLGPTVLAITSSPSVLKEVALQEGLLYLAKEVTQTENTFAFERAVTDLCATMACHSAIRAGQSLEERQMKELLISMDEFPLSSFCPHGRPVFVEYPCSSLERDFGRIV